MKTQTWNNFKEILSEVKPRLVPLMTERTFDRIKIQAKGLRKITFSLRSFHCYFWWGLLGRRKQGASWTEWALELLWAAVNQPWHVTHYLVFLNSGAWECASLASMVKRPFCSLVRVSIWLCQESKGKHTVAGRECWGWKSVLQAWEAPDELGRQPFTNKGPPRAGRWWAWPLSEC